MKKGAFVAGNHKCWFSRKPGYESMSVNDVLKKDPEYIIWCKQNLSYLRFSTGLSKRIKEARKNLAAKQDTISPLMQPTNINLNP